MNMDSVPMMIEAGFRLINITLDVWGFSQLVHNGVTKGKRLAQQMGEANGTVGK